MFNFRSNGIFAQVDFCFVVFLAFYSMNKENKLSFWIQTKILSLFSEAEEIKSNLLFGKGDGEGRTVQTGEFAAFTTLI